MPPPTGRSRSRLSSLVTRDINEEKVNYGLQLPDLSPTQAFVDRLVDETLAAEQEIMVEFELHSQEHMRMVRGENGEEVRYFACTGCRSLKDSGRNVQLPTRRANMTLNVWETNAKVPHSCTARDQHKVVGVGLARKVKKKVASGEMRATPAQAAVRLSTSVLQSFGNLDEGSKQQIRAAAMGTGRSLERSLRRAKQKRFHTSLKRLADLRQEDFPDLWQTLRGTSSTADSQFHGEQLIMFAGKPGNWECLAADETIVCDGSFKYAPRNTYQVYRIFGFVSDTHCVPLVTAVLTGKSEEIYDKMWGAVANVLPDYMFDFALFDF
ncbi:hypothetical protein AAVH_12532 [Aphelenchoides avenae]|nr:hypothetical protein AAVH_12532 [Aphelenchus avenae]